MNNTVYENLINKLFFDKKGQMYIISDIISRNYKEDVVYSFLYYACSDNGGLIIKTKLFKKKASEILSSGKFTFVNI